MLNGKIVRLLEATGTILDVFSYIIHFFIIFKGQNRSHTSNRALTRIRIHQKEFIYNVSLMAISKVQLH
jgi:hypothetical protein